MKHNDLIYVYFFYKLMFPIPFHNIENLEIQALLPQLQCTQSQSGCFQASLLCSVCSRPTRHLVFQKRSNEGKVNSLERFSVKYEL